MSVTNVLVADLRQVNAQNPWKKVNNALQIISQKWGPREVMPPYVETVASLFHISMLRNPNNVPTNKNGKAKVGAKNPSMPNRLAGYIA